jgi:hypothetical protein
MFFPTKMTMVLGIGAGGIIAISGFFVLIYACWRKHGSIRADKGGYTPKITTNNYLHVDRFTIGLLQFC